MQLDAERLIDTLASGLRAHLARRGIGTPLLFGIRTGGVGLAERLRVALGVAEPIGTLDISFHRDDDVRDGLDPQVRPSRIPVDPGGRDLVLVDDGTGATSTQGCNATFTNKAALMGKIALIDRGTCSFDIKVKNAQVNGAVAAIIANNRTVAAGGVTSTRTG